MSKKKNKNFEGGFVYSTNQNFDFDSFTSNDEQETLAPEEQDLRIWIECKGGNKVTSVVRGFVGTEEDLKDLGKKLKSTCGTGGTVKNQEIIIQGDHREKILGWLTKQGYKAKKSGG